MINSINDISYSIVPEMEFGSLPVAGLGGNKKIGDLPWLANVIEVVQSDIADENEVNNMFILNDYSVSERNDIFNQVKALKDILVNIADVEDMVSYCLAKVAEAETTYKRNCVNLLNAICPIEKSYRSIQLFFQNAEKGTITNLSFINCDANQLKDLEFPDFIECISEEVTKNYDRIDLRNSYGIVVLPGYLGSNTVLEKWAKIAHENKVIIVTDFEDVEEVDDVMELFDRAGLAGGETYRSSVIMCCNWVVSRGKYTSVGELTDFCLPPSMGLAGKIYASLISQVAAGKKFGVIEGAESVKFVLKKSEVSCLEKMNLVPMFFEYGKVMAFSAKTLFNGSNLGLQIYSVVRVFDYITKVLMDFLNRRTFENFNANIRKELMGQIVKFLDGVSGNGKLIEDFSVKRFEQDAFQKDKIHLDVHLKPYFPAKNFMIKLEGKKEDDGTSWDTTYDQQ